MPAPPAAGSQFGPYRLDEVLGRGGMGVVYRAYDTVHDRTVALKLLGAHLADDAEFIARFRRESRLVARLNEAHIIPIHAFGEIDGHLYLDMRLVRGVDLAEQLRTAGRLTVPVAVAIIQQVASALDAAHTDGLIHRDVKPSNILLTGSVQAADKVFAYLVDFGLARTEAAEGSSQVTGSASGSAIGTIAYLSPERVMSGPVDHRCDVYALACVLFEAIVGRAPFTGETVAIMYAHVHTPPPRPSMLVPGVPPALDEVIARGMAKRPQDRYATAGDLAAAAVATLVPPAPAPAPAPGPRAIGRPPVEESRTQRMPRVMASPAPPVASVAPRDSGPLDFSLGTRTGPQPAVSPRRAGGGGRSRRSSRVPIIVLVVLLLVAAAAVATVLVLSSRKHSTASTSRPGTTSRAGRTSARTSGSSTSANQRAQELSAQTNGEPNLIVALADGTYQAAVYRDDTTAIEFWTEARGASSWTKDGASTLPDPAGAQQKLTVEGAVLTGMPDTTFVVHGDFQGPIGKTRRAVAFTRTDSVAWGVIKYQDNGTLAPSGQPVTAGDDNKYLGLGYDIGLRGGDLTTTDCASLVYAANGDCTQPGTPGVWHWNGTAFVSG